MMNQKIRTFQNSVTNSEVSIREVYEEKDGTKWYCFTDLMNIPYIRKSAAQHVTNLYNAGISIVDTKNISSKGKALLKSNDPEKNEKLFSLFLQLENLIEVDSDPVKQSLGLCTVYFLRGDERIDIWNMSTAQEKMTAIMLNLDMQAFFLNWLSDGISNYTKLYEILTPTVSATPNE